LFSIFSPVTALADAGTALLSVFDYLQAMACTYGYLRR
jgi:hypothetical protein